MAPEFVPIPPLNRNALIGFLLSIFALLALCSGVLPLPFTTLLCYPPGGLLGIASIYMGVRGIREIRIDAKAGRGFALLGIWISSFSIAAFLCFLTVGVTLAPRITEYIKQLFN